jgi:hypothetical protein
MKPDGDPTQPKNPLPNVVKAMRFFGSSRYDNFSDEAFKVDNAGLPIPKWPKELNLEIPGVIGDARASAQYTDEWAADAHTNIPACR